jgi:hypothetical protein
MYRELTNLLPSEHSRAFQREYFMHLITVSVIALGIVIVVHGLFLMPTYLSLTDELTSEKTQLAALDSNLQGSEQRDIGSRIEHLSTDSAYLTKLGTISTASSAIRSILLVEHDGITLTGISFTPPTDTAQGTMLLTGVATTRDTLRQYDLALSGLPSVSKADLPISAYAKDTLIPFTITLTGAFTP